MDRWPRTEGQRKRVRARGNGSKGMDQRARVRGTRPNGPKEICPVEYFGYLTVHPTRRRAVVWLKTGKTEADNCDSVRKKAVYTTASVAYRWAGDLIWFK